MGAPSPLDGKHDENIENEVKKLRKEFDDHKSKI